MNKSVNISASRSFIMGCAIMWVSLFHYGIYFGTGHFQNLERIVSTIVNNGFFGVDIFLFVSAFGCVYSFDKERDIVAFLKRRVKKLAVVYIINILLLMVWCIYCKSPMNLVQFVANITCTGVYFQIGKQMNWYLQAIWLFYLIFPVLYYIILDSQKKALTTAKICFFAILLLIPIYGQATNIYYIVCRIPSFVLGVYFGLRSKNLNLISKNEEVIWYGILIIDFILYNWAYLKWPVEMNKTGMRWTMMIPMLLGIIMLFCRIHQTLSRYKIGNIFSKAIVIMGNCSVEMLIVHLFIRTVVRRKMEFLNILLAKRVILLLASCILAILFHYIVKRIQSNLKYYFVKLSAEVCKIQKNKSYERRRNLK